MCTQTLTPTWLLFLKNNISHKIQVGTCEQESNFVQRNSLVYINNDLKVNWGLTIRELLRIHLYDHFKLSLDFFCSEIAKTADISLLIVQSLNNWAKY